jgi:serine/threonine protein kinase
MYETKEERDRLFEAAGCGKFTEVDLLNKEATGFGWAILVQDNYENNRLKVVKLPNREEATRELRAEAEILAKIAQYLRHPNLIALGSVERHVIEWHGKKEDRWFIVLEYGGSSLRKRLGRLGLRCRGDKEEYVYQGGAPLSVDEVLHIGMQAADGLRALHDFEEAPGQHIIHRDIKPENILIDKQGTVRLADFGISKVVERLTQSIAVGGTAAYLAPEYSRGRITAVSDIYSLGIVLYEMATGRFPFLLPDDRFYQMPDAPHHLNPEVPERLSEIILRALWWDPHAGRGSEEGNRYRRAAELLQDLRSCYSSIHPVPARYTRAADKPGAGNVYRDTQSNDDVRIFLYETRQPARCVSRLALVVGLEAPGVLAPRQTFESEGRVGVVVAPAPAAHVLDQEVGSPPLLGTAGTPFPVVAHRAVYPLVRRLAILCRQLEQLHRLGVYHGFLTPYNIFWDGTAWVLDHVWLGPLIGLSPGENVLRRTDVAAGYLAPEVLRWEAPPALASDVYGIGAVLYGRLTGTPPMDPAAALAMTQGQPAPPFRAGSALAGRAPTASRRLRDLVVKALKTDPTERPRSIAALAEELDACRWPDDWIVTLLEDAREFSQHQDKLAEAYDALDEAQRLSPGDPLVHHARAEIYFREREFAWALKENLKALEVEATADRCYLQGQCLSALGRDEEALEFYRMGLEQEDCSRGRHLLAQCLDKIGQPRKALDEYRRALHFARLVEGNNELAQAIEAELSALASRSGSPDGGTPAA